MNAPGSKRNPVFRLILNKSENYSNEIDGIWFGVISFFIIVIAVVVIVAGWRRRRRQFNPFLFQFYVHKQSAYLRATCWLFWPGIGKHSIIAPPPIAWCRISFGWQNENRRDKRTKQKKKRSEAVHSIIFYTLNPLKSSKKRKIRDGNALEYELEQWGKCSISLHLISFFWHNNVNGREGERQRERARERMCGTRPGIW